MVICSNAKDTKSIRFLGLSSEGRQRSGAQYHASWNASQFVGLMTIASTAQRENLEKSCSRRLLRHEILTNISQRVYSRCVPLTLRAKR